MTLVVSDISRHGIVIVGDSAITTGGGAAQGGAAKVHYSPAANVGFATWGDARVGDIYMDEWLSDFAENHIPKSTSVEKVGQLLVDTLNPLMATNGRTWDDMRRGSHVAGYRGKVPVLFHVHSGPLESPAGPLKFFAIILMIRVGLPTSFKASSTHKYRSSTCAMAIIAYSRRSSMRLSPIRPA